VWDAEVPEGARVRNRGSNSSYEQRVDRVTLSNCRRVEDLPQWGNKAACAEALQQCMLAVTTAGDALQHVPNGMGCYALYEGAVLQNGLALHHVPANKMWGRLILCALRQNGLALRHVPHARQTAKQCLLAVRRAPAAMCHVCPQHMEAACVQAVYLDADSVRHTRRHQTPELCLRIAQVNGAALRHMRYKTRAVCEQAVRSRRSALPFVPHAHYEHCAAIVRGL